MTTGMTMKQLAKEEFWKALAAYKTALAGNDSHALVLTSLRVRAALGDMPRGFKKYVNEAYREASKTKST